MPPPLPIHIYGNGGLGHIFDNIYKNLPGGISGLFKNGVDFQGGMDWVGKKYMGAGILYSGYRSGKYHTNFNYNPDWEYAKNGNPVSRMYLDYIGPEFVTRVAINKKWGIRASMGLGAFILKVKKRWISIWTRPKNSQVCTIKWG